MPHGFADGMFLHISPIVSVPVSAIVCFGLLACLNGRYDGSWVNDERHGHGVLDHEPMGYLYVGQWQHNKKSGEGHLYSRKERYWGNFVDNKYHGRVRWLLGIRSLSDRTIRGKQ